MPFDLLERGRELSMLEQCLQGVRETRRGRTVVVSGEAGVGKTSLVRSFCADHNERVAVLAGNCEALFAPRSLGPVLDIADADAGELYRMTAGNPFFVVEALASGVDGIPGTVRDAVLARGARLSPTANVVLEAAALTPPHSELWLLEALVGSLDGLEECLTSGM